MAYLRQAKTEEEIKALTVAKVKKEYNTLAADYNRLINLDYIYCHQCGEFITRNNFYFSNKTKSGVIPLGCKRCILKMATDYDKKTNTYTDNREKTIQTLKEMDLPFIESLYVSSLSSVQNEVFEKNKSTAFQLMLTTIRSLPQYRNNTFEDSVYTEDEVGSGLTISKTAKQKAQKFFGIGFSDQDYAYLQNQYDDWKTRYSIENKSLEELVKRICFTQLSLLKAQQQGKDTKDLDKTFQDLLGSANLKPNQNKKNTLSEAQTFGQLIDVWENNKPIPEPEAEFKDVDKIGLYLDVFFKGHLARMLRLKNPLSHIYDKFMKKYTVNKPEYNEEENSEDLFNTIFGSSENDDKI